MRARRTFLVVLATLGLLAGVMPAAHADTSTDTYIVVLKNTVSASSLGKSVLGSNVKTLPAAHAAIVELTAAKAASLATNPNVRSVQKNVRVKKSGTQTNPPWDLDVLDSRAGTLDHSYTYPNTGSGVTAYVVDSGLTTVNSEFATASVGVGINFVQRGSAEVVNPDPALAVAACGSGIDDTSVDPTDTVDQAGHGTAVTSLIVGATFGVAKGATVVPVRVLDCNGGGYATDVYKAVDWILANHAAGAPAVVNISLGTAGNVLDLAAQELIDAGITVVAAAGNDNQNACLETPARVPGVLTVAATTQSNAEPVWPDGQGTNYGSCVDFYAPGDSVIAASREAGMYEISTGTSFSSPLAAGGAVLALADHPTWTPAQVSADLTSRATYGVINGARSVNKLLNVGPLGVMTGTAPTLTAPTRVADTVTAVTHWTPVPTSATYQWNLDGSAITGATTISYVPVAADEGKTLTVTVTGSYPGYADISDTSAGSVVAAAPPPPPAGMVTSLSPSRLLDTRIGQGAWGPMTNGRTVSIPVRGVGGVSSNASAVLINITCTDASSSGFISGHASGTGMPGVSSANFVAGKTGANLALIPVGDDGAIWLTSAVSNGGTVQLVVDLQGFVSGGGAVTEAGAVVPVSPQRLADTRMTGSIGGGGTLNVMVAGAAGVPSGAAAAFLNVTVTQPGTPGFLTAYPGGENRPATSNVNFVPGQTVPNMVLVKIGGNGIVSIFNSSATAVHIIVDIQGYVTPGTPTATGAIVPMSPLRVLDTRYGIGTTPGIVYSGTGRTIYFTGSGLGTASGVFLNITATGPSGSGYLSAYPANSGRPAVSNLNFDAGATVPNLAAVALNNSQCRVDAAVTNNGSVAIVADVFAYII